MLHRALHHAFLNLIWFGCIALGCPRKWHFGIPRNTEVISGAIPAKFRGIPPYFAEFRRNCAEITSEVKKFRGIPCRRNSVDTLNRTPIPVGRRGVIFLFKWFLPAFPRVEEGDGGRQAPCDITSRGEPIKKMLYIMLRAGQFARDRELRLETYCTVNNKYNCRPYYHT